MMQLVGARWVPCGDRSHCTPIAARCRPLLSTSRAACHGMPLNARFPLAVLAHCRPAGSEVLRGLVFFVVPLLRVSLRGDLGAVDSGHWGDMGDALHTRA